MTLKVSLKKIPKSLIQLAKKARGGNYFKAYIVIKLNVFN
jgi:hypothetical protein